MGRAETLTKLPLTRWAQIVGVHPLHFGGVYVDDPTVCQQPWMQFAHQAHDRVSREDLAQAIAQAESDIERELGFRLLPTWEVDEWRPTNRPVRPELFNLNNRDVRGLGPVVQADWGYLISGGIRSKILVSDDEPITYTDEDGDTYKETATISVPVSFTNPCEVSLYFPSGGPVPGDALDEWEIKPINVSIAVGIATITLRREQLVKPELQSVFVPPAEDSHIRGVDGTDAANFVAAVDIYRVYNDPQQQVQFLWEPWGCSLCGGEGCDGCAYSSQYGCILSRDLRNSILVYQPADWNSETLEMDNTSWAVGREPTLVRLWYYAGWQDKKKTCPTKQMDGKYERAVAYYAASLLDRPVCGCDNVTAYVDRWQRDLAVRGEEGLQISRDNLDNPFGTRSGAVFAWRRLQDARGIGVLA